MQIIHKEGSGIAGIWNAGKVHPVPYRLFTFLIATNVEGGTLLHNTATGELLFLDNAEMTQLAQLPCSYAPWMDTLIQKHFIIKAEIDDKATIDGLRSVFRLANSADEITKYVVLPTTACNARCFYCYEAGRSHETMGDETADKLVDFMSSHRGGKPILINWFGGEPLLGMRQIDRISAALKEKKIEFSSSMVSNGFLFSKEAVRKAKEEWLLKNVQITLDGTEKVYNETKAYVIPCDSPYKTVMENIGLLLEAGIKVSIRLNLGANNADDLDALVDEIAGRFQDRTNLSIYSQVLISDCGFAPVHFDSDEYNRLCKINERLSEKIRTLSFSSPNDKLPHLKTKHCTADNVHAFVVAPSGRLGKCYHYTEDHFVGSIEEGITNTHEIQHFREYVTLPACAECPLYPSCIKLKMCVPEKPCTPEAVQAKINEAIRIIKGKYKKYLSERGNQE